MAIAHNTSYLPVQPIVEPPFLGLPIFRLRAHHAPLTGSQVSEWAKFIRCPIRTQWVSGGLPLGIHSAAGCMLLFHFFLLVSAAFLRLRGVGDDTREVSVLVTARTPLPYGGMATCSAP
jgi:hypothetical protein